MAGVFDEQGMPTPPKHLILTMVYSGVRVCNALIFVFICTFNITKILFYLLALTCQDTPCLNGGICTDVGASFQCKCPYTHTGDVCETGERINLLI